MKTNSKKGFSLVELLVVITIMAILSVVAYMALGGQTAKARNSKRMQELSTLQSALEIHFLNNNNTYPTKVQFVADALVTDGLIQEMPVDPASSDDYSYNVGPSNKTYQLSAHLESETGKLNNIAYVIGNASSDVITDGCTYTPATGACNCGVACTVTDDSPTCMPYCLSD